MDIVVCNIGSPVVVALFLQSEIPRGYDEYAVGEIMSETGPFTTVFVRGAGQPTPAQGSDWRLPWWAVDHAIRLRAPESGETYTDVAHEAIFRRWDKLRQAS